MNGTKIVLLMMIFFIVKLKLYVMTEIKAGDVVCLKSDVDRYLKMTVQLVSKETAVCVWINKDKNGGYELSNAEIKTILLEKL